MTLVPQISRLGERAIVLSFPSMDTQQQSLALQGKLWWLATECRHSGDFDDIVPGMNNLTLFLARDFDLSDWESRLQRLWQQAKYREPDRKRIVIPVIYGGNSGPDLDSVAKYHALTRAQLIALHSGAEYRVYFLGFLPGFAYLGGLPSRLHTPRHANPRLMVPAGSVGIGGQMTGIYPSAAPGGWQLLGHTQIPLFDPTSDPPSLLMPGDCVTFSPVEDGT
ncbi:5-oxoprolinase subunit PxpB [Shewanella sp. AS16]|uniref:5-oxoprolinase subunit PxpB n=1 Tax=Shewanella sp. AS16 TaxID=2907625 RepID=UPI001F19B095|nr:5-oxoprolinase subunit PxpB [Shewanella sp. AS16]MCE9688076.1 5-oxoprolinase subunit PxpB [Shewanella sp. AS16]